VISLGKNQSPHTHKIKPKPIMTKISILRLRAPKAREVGRRIIKTNVTDQKPSALSNF